MGRIAIWCNTPSLRHRWAGPGIRRSNELPCSYTMISLSGVISIVLSTVCVWFNRKWGLTSTRCTTPCVTVKLTLRCNVEVGETVTWTVTGVRLAVITRSWCPVYGKQCCPKRQPGSEYPCCPRRLVKFGHYRNVHIIIWLIDGIIGIISSFCDKLLKAVYSIFKWSLLVSYLS